MVARVVYIGGESCITPLGKTVGENFKSLFQGESAISIQSGAGFHKQDLYLSAFANKSYQFGFEELVIQSVEASLASVDKRIIESEKTIVLISSTKGDLLASVKYPFDSTLQSLKQKFLLKNDPFVVSSACISGVSSFNIAARYLTAGLYDHAVVVGCDVLSDFIIYGFQSLFAVSNEPCRPFDKSRSGVSLGEGSAAAIVSVSKDIFKETPLELLGGTISNDANHISGPSRTGEGLFRSVNRTLAKHPDVREEIGFISAHGTATLYNDEMESIAFSRLGFSEIPINSFKGYIGHTLGAAGVIEIVYTMQSLRNQKLIKSLGFEETGTSGEINVIRETQATEFSVALKTASGFGGCNASLLIRKV